MGFLAVLRLDRDVHQFVVVAEKRSIIIRRPRLVGDDRNNRGKFSGANLPDMEIGHDRIAVAFYRAPYLVRQIGGKRCSIDQNDARVSQQLVSP